MIVLGLLAIAKQNLQVSAGGNLYDINVLETGGCTSMDITRGTDVVVLGQRCVAGQLCIPYLNLEAAQGNFMFLTQNDELPSYVSFGISQFLLYASNAELVAVRANPEIILATIMATATMVGAASVHGVT